MLFVCICENNGMTSKKYKEMLVKASRRHDIDIYIQVFQSGEALLQAYSKQTPDIIFMDIYLEGMNGIETARQLQLESYQPSLIFLTNSEEHVYEAFDVRPVNYLIKGKTTEAEFARAFLRAADIAKQRRKEFLHCRFRDSHIAVPLIDISYIHVSKRLITVHYKDRETQFYSNLEKLEKQLQNTNLLRIHRSYIVNLLHITAFCLHRVVL
ncbi:MAG: LytTR family DNA-binding domain-containing protein, partial [Lacrimispora sp.]